MTPVLTGKTEQSEPKPKPVNYRPPAGLVAEIDEAAKGLGISRNEAMTQLLRFALDAHWKEKPRKAKK
ncbi:MAG: ribbon-helix-helix domain-containing protein [Myxococcaceae bacterium]